MALGEAQVPIRATLDKLDGDLAQARGKIEGATKKLGKIGATVGKAALAGVVTGILAIGAALAGVGVTAVKTSLDFDQATKAIVIGTGAAGEELAEMEGIVKNLRGTTAGLNTDFGEMGQVVADVQTRTGATGETLQDLSGDVLNLSRLTGMDATESVGLLTRVMGDWDVATEDSAALLDTLFAASQITGAGVDDLARQVVQFGAPLRQFGFDMEEGIALLGKWEQEGVNTELVMGSLRIAMGNFARENVPLREGLEDTFQTIQELGPGAEATALAMEIFGARAGPDMAAAILEGRFEIEDLVGDLKDAEGALDDASERSLTLGERFQIMKNRVTTALMPLGDAILGVVEEHLPAFEGAVDSAVGWLEENLPAAIETASTWLGENLPAAIDRGRELFAQARGVIEDVQGVLQNVASRAQELAATWGGVWTNIQERTQTAIESVKAFIQPAVDAISGWWEEHGVTIQAAVLTAWTVIQAAVQSAIKVIRPAVEKFVSNVSGNLDAFKPAIDAVKGAFESLKPIILPVLAVIGAAVLGAVAMISGVINGLATAVGPAIHTFAGVVTLIATVVEMVATGVVNTIGLIVAVIQGDMGRAKEIWRDHWEAMGGLFGQLVDSIKQIFLGFVGTIIGFAMGLAEGVKSWFQNMYDALVGGSIIPDMVNAILGWIGSLVEGFTGLISGLWTSVTEAFEAGKTFVSETITSIKDTVSETVTGLKETVVETVGELWSSVQEAFNTAKEALTEIVETIASSLPEPFTNVISDMIAVGADILDGVITGIENVKGNLREMLSGVADLIPGWLQSFLGIGSPARALIPVGEAIGEGIVQGILNQVPAVEDAVQALADAAGTLGQLGGQIARLFEQRTLAPIESELDRLDQKLAMRRESLAERLGVDEDALDLTREFFRAQDEGNESVLRAIRGIWDIQNRRIRTESELAEQQERVLELQKQQQDLQLLEAQQRLLDLIRENNLSAGILDGLELGLDADLGGILQATTQAMEAIIRQTEESLGISSPSKKFMEIGRNITESLKRGITQPQFELGRMLPVMQLAGDNGPVDRSVHYSSQTTVQTNRDPMRVLRASRHLDKLGGLL